MTNKNRNYIYRRRSLGGNPKGFTLIETLLAVAILATAIAGPLTLASKGLSTALVAKDQTTAFYLAQDAIEYVRFVRDSNSLQKDDWLQGAAGDLSPCITPNVCTVDTLSSSIAACLNGACPALNILKDSSGNFVQFTTDNAGNVAPSLFTRAVTIKVISGTEALLSATVTWKDLPGVTHSIVVKESLLDWQKI